MAMMQFLSTLFVSRFYKQNTGFFLFLFIILFGILPGTETIRLHRGLMEAATANPLYLIIACAVFAVYNLKCAAFVAREIGLPENSFLYHIQTRSAAWQCRVLTGVYVSIYLPLLTYGVLTFAVGMQSAHYTGAIAVLLWQVAMIATGVYVAYRKLNDTWKPPVFSLPNITLFRSKGYYSYLLHYSIYSRKGAFISIKIFSLLALQLLVALNADKASKENICFLIMLCISAHALLPAYYVQFIETEMSFVRALPLSIYKRFGLYIATYSIVLLPELLFLLWNEINIIPVSVILSLYALAITRLTLYTSIQYLPNMTTDRYTGVIFIMFFISVILLASVGLWVFVGVELAVAITTFVVFYYKFEATHN